MLNIDLRGYCLENKDVHVCGYEGNKVLIQSGDYKEGKRTMTKHTIYNNNKGHYFTLKGKRVYLPSK